MDNVAGVYVLDGSLQYTLWEVVCADVPTDGNGVASCRRNFIDDVFSPLLVETGND